jgi:hypothetical protein
MRTGYSPNRFLRRHHGGDRFVIKDASGDVVFIVSEGRDISEKKAYEEQIGQKNEELQAPLQL